MTRDSRSGTTARCPTNRKKCMEMDSFGWVDKAEFSLENLKNLTPHLRTIRLQLRWICEGSYFEVDDILLLYYQKQCSVIVFNVKPSSYVTPYCHLPNGQRSAPQGLHGSKALMIFFSGTFGIRVGKWSGTAEETVCMSTVSTGRKKCFSYKISFYRWVKKRVQYKETIQYITPYSLLM